MDLVCGDMHLINHILYQEQAPPAWRLQACQLGFQVWGLWFRDDFSPSPVGNADRHLQAMEAIFHHLQKDDFRRFIRQAATMEAMKEVILDAERSGT